MSDFVVRIDTAKLNAKQAANIAAAIQGAVLAELGNLDMAHEPGEHKAGANFGGIGSVLLHPEWRGIWIRDLQEFNKPMPALVVTAGRVG